MEAVEEEEVVELAGLGAAVGALIEEVEVEDEVAGLEVLEEVEAEVPAFVEEGVSVSHTFMGSSFQSKTESEVEDLEVEDEGVEVADLEVEDEEVEALAGDGALGFHWLKGNGSSS